MGRAMSEAFPAARAVYDRAAEAVGFDLAELCFEGPIERLSETDDHAAGPRDDRARLPRGSRPRPASGPTSWSATRSASTRPWPRPASIDDRTAAHLTRERGLATAAAAAATPGAMAAIIGLDDAEVERICDGHRRRLGGELQLPRPGRRERDARGRRRLHGGRRGGRRAPRRQAQGLGRLPQPAHRARRRAPRPRARGDDVRRAGRAVLLDGDLPARGRARDRPDPAAAAHRTRPLHAGGRWRCATSARARSSRSGRAACSRA